MSNLEKEIYTARAQVMDYLVQSLRKECYALAEKTDFNRTDGRMRRILCRRSELLIDNVTLEKTSLRTSRTRASPKTDRTEFRRLIQINFTTIIIHRIKDYLSGDSKDVPMEIAIILIYKTSICHQYA
ncbi:unnamed protein product [Echinostoma caproni]|uniref:Uncharacterized protein n=1 Tax=Echinostoma caproni TaxID=27848 RepID=A0A3P8H1Y9_9TREM|nr:unnamed protein product [Echinostoma caproni]